MPSIHINEVILIESNDSDTLLETMEKAGLQPEYHCRDGHCGSCKCAISAGEVDYVGFPLAYLAPGEVLPCIAKARSSISLHNVNYIVNVNVNVKSA